MAFPRPPVEPEDEPPEDEPPDDEDPDDDEPDEDPEEEPPEDEEPDEDPEGEPPDDEDPDDDEPDDDDPEELPEEASLAPGAVDHSGRMTDSSTPSTLPSDRRVGVQSRELTASCGPSGQFAMSTVVLKDLNLAGPGRLR